ncbi:cytochrome c biogenesis protein ResB [Pelomonas sp. KK5]|uniref:cytochrome c biogenesis protein ResB n=1 Tax=Pelomonas sp. KK5 TaxID=1855730 RepID=UPI00097C0287|nr:cytochrome c biogenesis protein ResB [Pelomonas sp. KK5]
MSDELLSPQAPPPANSAGRELIDLLSSMRFAITVFVVIIIASITGTVVRQHEPLNNYVNQFGPFWSELFGKVGLYTIYGAWWFLVLLAFLVVSTTLCIARNAPKIVHDLKTYKEHVREQSLQAHHHKAIGSLPVSGETALGQVSAVLDQLGWKAKAQVRPNGTMVAARRGMANKIGYLSAHSAIVLICLGGLSDGDIVVKALMKLQGKSVYTGAGLVSEVPAQNRLSPSNPSFRGTLPVPEGGRAATAIINMPDGVVLQDLPFDVELKKFIVEYYQTGMPKLFASDIAIRDHATGKITEHTVKVNAPVIHDGIAIYQSSFDDGGSKLKLTALPLRSAQAKPFAIEGAVGGGTLLSNGNGDDKLTLEFSGLRVINVENLAGGKDESASGADVRKVDLADALGKHLGSGAKSNTPKTLHNVGPSFSYRLRDAAGQAREYNNYMAPVELDGQRVFLAGVRDDPNESFRYLRIPVDEDMGMDGWLRMRQNLADPVMREGAAHQYAVAATPGDKPQMTPQLEATAKRALALFAGVEGVKPGEALPAGGWGGLPALSQFIESEVPAAERQRVSEVLLRILNGSLYELYKLGRERANLAPPAGNEATQAFMTQAVLSLSDSMYYPAPVLLRLDDFTQIQQSVFQVTRAPGQKLVYLGAIFLIIGVFAMLYVKERRVWIWLEPTSPDNTRVRMALSSTRDSPDTGLVFEQLKAALQLKE